ncbi:MAG: ABC transporter ATP-binding protein [Hyphomicrobiales bacterium]|nr:ABC transporter ATP-binding protein [Hyphomicrobiales bacterium]
MSSVTFKSVGKSFGPLSVIRSLDLVVPDQKFIALLGPSGCGKTTALRMLAGLELPTSGQIFIGKRDVTRLQPRDRDVAMVFQSYALYPQMTVAENIGYPLRIRKVPQAEATAKIADVAESLEVTHLLGRYPRQLSGGQRQRIALARAIVRNPAAFLMDEPLSNLDARLRLIMRGEIKRLCQHLGATTIYVTHDQAEALTMADLVAVMKAGELQQLAPPADVYERPANRFVATFVGSPPMNVLALRSEASAIQVGNTRLKLSAPLLKACLAAEVTEIGIRPEDVLIGDANAPSALPGEIYVIEPTGHETLVDVRVGKERVCVRVPRGFHGRIGDSIGLIFDMEDACFFNSQGATVIQRTEKKGEKK